MPNQLTIQGQARASAREELGKDPEFLKKSRQEQFALYKHRVKELLQQLSRQQQLAEAMAAADLVPAKDLENPDIAKEGEYAGETLQQVNFPKFVSDLLNGVFQANLDVIQKQMDSYADLVDRITKPASKFIDEIDKDAAYAFVAEKHPDRYQLLSINGDSSNSDFGKDLFDKADSSNKGGGDTGSQFTLGDADGNPVDTESEDINREIVQAKLQLVRQHQQLLEEMLLMGVTRLVVDQGKVKASVDFKIDARSKTKKLYRGKQVQKERKGHMHGNRGFFHPVWDQGDSTTISISTAKAGNVSTTDSRTEVKGEVEINFKTDYFPLDNFKEILMNRDNSGSVKPKTDQTQNGQTQNGQTQNANQS